jgi:hypothetical protein
MNREMGRPRIGHVVLAALAAFLLSVLTFSAAASASTIGVPNLEVVPVSTSGAFTAPPPYTVWQSGNRDGTPAFYASEPGFLTDVSVSHWNTSAATVRILIFRRDAGDAIKVAQSSISMLLPAAPSSAPIMTTAPVSDPTTIQVGDRIGMTMTSGSSPLHAFVDNSSLYPAPGVYPATPPSTEPATGSSYDFIDSAPTGPLIRGTVSATPGGGSARTTPLAVPAKVPLIKGGTKKIVTSAHCNGLGIRSRCTGKVTVELDYQGNVISVTEASAGANVLGSASYDIPDGATQTLSINLNKAGRSRIQKKGKLRAFLVFTEEIDGKSVSTGTPFTAKSKKKRKK